MRKLIVVVFALIFSSSVFAAPEYAGKIRGLYVNKSKLVLVKLDVSTSECGDTNWPFQFNLNDPTAKEWMSMLLAARTSNAKIYIGYVPNSTGRCGIEYIYYYN